MGMQDTLFMNPHMSSKRQGRRAQDMEVRPDDVIGKVVHMVRNLQPLSNLQQISTITLPQHPLRFHTDW